MKNELDTSWAFWEMPCMPGMCMGSCQYLSNSAKGAHLLEPAETETGRNITPLVAGYTLTSSKYSHTCASLHSRERSSMWDWHSCHMSGGRNHLYRCLRGHCTVLSHGVKHQDILTRLWSTVCHTLSIRTELKMMIWDISKGVFCLCNFRTGGDKMLFDILGNDRVIKTLHWQLVPEGVKVLEKGTFLIVSLDCCTFWTCFQLATNKLTAFILYCKVSSSFVFAHSAKISFSWQK